MPQPIRTFVCTRQVECLIEVQARTVQEALTKLPQSADDLVEQADACAFGTNWSVQLGDVRNEPQSFDDADVQEARDSGAGEFMPGDD